jgi:hypothetical protein
VYVKKDETAGNPIEVASLNAWQNDQETYSRTLSDRFERATRLHEEVTPARTAQGLRLAFASQVGENLQLQVRDIALSSETEAPTLQVRKEVDDRTAFLRSALFPGLGQLHRGQRMRGWVVAGAAGTALATTLASAVMASSNASAYQEDIQDFVENTPNVGALSEDEILEHSNFDRSSYDAMNTFETTRTVSLLAFAGIWAWNLYDSLQGPGYVPQPVYTSSSLRVERPTMSVTRVGNEPAYGLSLRIQF